MAAVRFHCDPEITNRVRIGGPGSHQVLIGRVRDSGRNSHPVYFDADNNFVVLKVGKRGSGKSFGMGAASRRSPRPKTRAPWRRTARSGEEFSCLIRWIFIGLPSIRSRTAFRDT